MRKLASIQKIHHIEPIEEADKIELVHVLGWQCVAGKGDFKPMDLCVYFEIDSFLPIDDKRYEFLRSKSYKKSDVMGEGYLLRTMRFKGKYSQGLVLPLSAFSDIPEIADAGDESLGKDVTDLLHVRKWEIEERVTDSGTIIGKRPSFIPKTDETRVQSELLLTDELAGKPYYITTKMDGSSHSIGIDEDGVFHVCGHNYEYADDGKSAFYEFVKKHRYENLMRDFMEIHELTTLVIQGEWCGPGIQTNPIDLKKPHWFAFAVIVNGKRLRYVGLKDVCDYIGIEMVPVVETGSEFHYT